ncbi:hypothetical protein NCS57_00516800 [Fusarium keratoplasticum]|uniref:Uncharacterized protein n=1 Tax=Fusarium keratoplasticum TaxID=1328300 RepID=A0ACC0QXX2_9HYPO|nr:hypothetical protein NCS57_00516800 [Fusarium keratoplasticum]KAI8670455.1 hypothetical protein NCS57_00516800 [Fusarium keratoplasticum]
MPAHKRKLSLNPKPQPHRLRSSSRSRKAPSDSWTRSRHGQQNANADESGDEYVDESEENDDEDADNENDRDGDNDDSTQDVLKNHESDGETDEDEPPRLTIIPLERMRDAGDIKYVDFRIHPNSLVFLEDLKENNNRAWLKAHDGEFRRAFKNWETFVERTTSSVMSIDDTIPELPAKDVMFRIYRDLRFSPDKKPYKAHFSAAWSRTGRKGTYAHYYIHFEPGASFIAGGIFAPNAQQLRSVRASIDERPRRWRRILNDRNLKESFMPSLKTGSREDEALKYFARENKESALKTKPKGFIANHRDIELLKLRKFTLSKKIQDDLLLADNTQEKVTEILRPLVGFITFLNSIVMPDGDSSSSESDDSGGDD